MNDKIFHKMSYGLYVVAAKNEDKLNGQIANTVFQISSAPPIVAISINKKNLTHEFIKAGKVFSVSILPKTVALDFIGHFGFKSGRDVIKYQDVLFKQGINGANVLLEQSLGFLEAEVIHSIDVETHTIFIGKVVDAEVFSDGEPMTYAYYHQVKSGTAPALPAKEAKAVQQEKIATSHSGQYQCSVCGYVYDPAQGNLAGGIAPGTAFTELPDGWVCPVCGVGKELFTEK